VVLERKAKSSVKPCKIKLFFYFYPPYIFYQWRLKDLDYFLCNGGYFFWEGSLNETNSENLVLVLCIFLHKKASRIYRYLGMTQILVLTLWKVHPILKYLTLFLSSILLRLFLIKSKLQYKLSRHIFCLLKNAEPSMSKFDAFSPFVLISPQIYPTVWNLDSWNFACKHL